MGVVAAAVAAVVVVAVLGEMPILGIAKLVA
jgi:hypothetical protein